MTKKNQSGNILLFILIAILLIGLLTVSLTRSSNQSNDTGDYEQNVIAANKLLAYTKSMQIATQTLLQRGCGENDISFENTVETGYINPNSPADKSCHIFEPEGAGLNWEVADSRLTSLPWIVLGDVAVHGVGTTNSPTVDVNVDLTLILPDISDSLCTTINNILNNNLSVIPVDTGDIIDGGDLKFGGDYNLGDNITGETSADNCPADSQTPLCGVSSGCFKEETGNEYNILYSVLHPR